jgi:predicted nucleic acid-binding Zn ribbon protein
MICNQCLCDCKDKDFYKSDICYRCVYKNKRATIAKYVKPFKLCRICKSKVPPGKDVYCCDECAYQGKQRKDKEYWVHKCSAPKISWKN